MLTASGILPPRDEGLARAEHWAAGIIGSIDPTTATGG